MMADGELAPGDLVAWHDYYDDRVLKVGLALSLLPEHAVVLWCDGRTEVFGENLDVLFGTTIRVRLPAARLRRVAPFDTVSRGDLMLYSF